MAEAGHSRAGAGQEFLLEARTIRIQQAGRAPPAAAATSARQLPPPQARAAQRRRLRQEPAAVQGIGQVHQWRQLGKAGRRAEPRQRQRAAAKPPVVAVACRPLPSLQQQQQQHKHALHHAEIDSRVEPSSERGRGQGTTSEGNRGRQAGAPRHTSSHRRRCRRPGHRLALRLAPTPPLHKITNLRPPCSTEGHRGDGWAS